MKEDSIKEDMKILEGIIKGDEDCINAIYSQMKVKNDNDEDIQYYKKEIQSIKNIVDNYLKEKGYKICIASSSSVPHIKKLVGNCGFDFQADLMLSSQDEYASKPAPDLFLACAKKMGVKPENCIVLEDSKNGIRAAYNANMRRVWIPDQVQFDEEDMKYVDLQCKDLKRVIDILEAM